MRCDPFPLYCALSNGLVHHDEQGDSGKKDDSWNEEVAVSQYSLSMRWALHAASSLRTADGETIVMPRQACQGCRATATRAIPCRSGTNAISSKPLAASSSLIAVFWP